MLLHCRQCYSLDTTYSASFTRVKTFLSAPPVVTGAIQTSMHTHRLGVMHPSPHGGNAPQIIQRLHSPPATTTSGITLPQKSQTMMFPGATPATFKSNMIWTEISVDSLVTPVALLEEKFRDAIDAAPYPQKWVTFTPEDLDNISASMYSEYYGAYYPSANVEEHLTLINNLRTIRLNDKFSISNITVLDARIDVIGHSVPPERMIPAVNMKTILTGERYHRQPNDGISFPPITPQNKTIFHEVTMQPMDIGNTPHKAHVCVIGDGNVYNRRRIHYFTENGLLFIKNEHINHTMQRVYIDHTIWLASLDTVDRDVLIVLAKTYDSDTNWAKNPIDMYLNATSLLYNAYVAGEWHRYQCIGDPPEEADLIDTQSLHTQLEYVYNAHATMLLNTTHIDHLSHKSWTKVYETDPFMDSWFKKILKYLIDRNLRNFVQGLTGSHFIDGHQQAAIDYSQSMKPFKTERSIHLLPYFLW